MQASKPVGNVLGLEGAVALVTGGGRGIGEAIAVRLAEAGAAVTVVDRDEAAARGTVDQIVAKDRRATSVAADVGDPSAARAAVRACVDRFGRLDVLVNNAGIFPFSPVERTTPELWDRVLGVNLTGSFRFAQEASQVMIAQGEGGAIVNIASVDAIRPTGNLAHYDASKGGLVMLTRALALELGPKGIRVNAIAPGGIATPGARSAIGVNVPAGADVAGLSAAFLARIPLGRMGEPDEIALAVLFLASRAASYVTGATHVVDGGYLVG